jgi:AcrR family transcriptional regulator
MGTTFEGSARERLLAAANELFYAEGIHTVGIDRVIERAGVAKASLYATFGSKEELVRAYLELRGQSRRERITRRIETLEGPRARILAVFDVLGETAAEPGFRGCAFVNASAEAPRQESKVSEAREGSRTWLRGLLIGLSRELGAKDPERLGRRLALVYDGAIVGASVDRDPSIVHEARAIAETLVELEVPLAAASKTTKKLRRSPER